MYQKNLSVLFSLSSQGKLIEAAPKRSPCTGACVNSDELRYPGGTVGSESGFSVCSELRRPYVCKVIVSGSYSFNSKQIKPETYASTK